MPATTTAAPRKAKRSRGLGWVPDLPDKRDKLYAAIAAPPKRLPKSVDLRPQCSPVENQGTMNSCTGNALVGALEFIENKNRLPFVNLSRLFIYYNERDMENDLASDRGAYIRDGIKSLVKLGVCSEAKWPYSQARLYRRPTPACFQEAADHQITSYHRIATVTEMRKCLAEGYPFVFGFTVYTAFDSEKVAETGELNLPAPGEKVEGGHAVLAVGYDDATQRFTVRNSWGRKWGQDGYFTMPYDYLGDRSLSDDLWTIRRGENL